MSKTVVAVGRQISGTRTAIIHPSVDRTRPAGRDQKKGKS